MKPGQAPILADRWCHDGLQTDSLAQRPGVTPGPFFRYIKGRLLSGDAEEEIGVIAEPVGHALDDLDLVVDALDQISAQRSAAVREDVQ
jgi:hypothetical protein